MNFIVFPGSGKRADPSAVARTNSVDESMAKPGGMRMNVFLKYSTTCACLVMLAVWGGCNDDFVPRPRAFPVIHFPAHAYTSFDKKGFPYTFSVPTYALCEPDSAEHSEPFWLNVVYPSLNATVHLTYKSLLKTNVDRLIYESFKLTNKQMYKATRIERQEQKTPAGYDAVFFRVSGDAATAHQFFVTDAKRHFLRGALYFHTTPNADSLRNANAFIFEDIREMVNTLRFR